MKIQLSAFDLAQRFVGVEEVAGSVHNPQIVTMLRLDQKWPVGDEVPWCSAFCNYIAWLLRLPRSKSLAARSWLAIGSSITLYNAEPENDVVIIKRGIDGQPGPEVLNAPGHVGFFAGKDNGRVLVLGGNQSDSVNVSPFKIDNILGIRRLM